MGAPSKLRLGGIEHRQSAISQWPRPRAAFVVGVRAGDRFRRILLLMHFDHSKEWLRLAQEYRVKGDEELLELNRDFVDLTETAQQALTAEFRSRGLDKKIAEQREAAEKADRFAGSYESPWARPAVSPFVERAAAAGPGGLLGSIVGSSSAELVPDVEEADSESGEPVELSWKTVLCDCEAQDQAYQIRVVLRRARIESWTESRERGLDYIRILVAADELDRARVIIANPIPQDIVDESHETAPEYQAPRCPGCGAEDPVLESAEPVNAWKCEICGREWTDAAVESKPTGPFT